MSYRNLKYTKLFRTRKQTLMMDYLKYEHLVEYEQFPFSRINQAEPDVALFFAVVFDVTVTFV